MATITTIGTGYVGLVTGAGFADKGNDVICLDIDKKKIEMLEKGEIPFYEPDLKEMVQRNVEKRRLRFTTDYQEAVKKSGVIFICVGTPPNEDGSADLSYIFDAAKQIAENINQYKVIVNKSTVPPQTGDRVEKVISENISEGIEFDVVSNPEFLQEGKAVKSFENPPRIVIGANNDRAKSVMEHIYQPFKRTGRRIITTSRVNAELSKYASNAMLATRISFMNELSHISEKIGADITKIAEIMGTDPRIGPKFLHAGTGYGGSCFPKDVKALVTFGKELGYTPKILETVDSVNEVQKLSLLPKVEKVIELKGSTIAILGLSFKPKTDDIREAPSLKLIPELLKKGAKIKAYCPEGMTNAKKVLGNTITYCKDTYNALEDADVAVILTEWDEFRALDLERTKKLMNKPSIVDGRNILDPDTMEDAGFNYSSVGR